MQRISWKAGQYTTSYGYVNGVQLFSISWTTTRNDPEPWKLRTTLPISLAKVMSDCATTDDAKATAERALTAFINRLGAQWTEESNR